MGTRAKGAEDREGQALWLLQLLPSEGGISARSSPAYRETAESAGTGTSEPGLA